MGNAISATVGMVSFLNPWPGASATVAVHSGVRIRDLQLLATAAGVFISVGFIYRHLHRGAGNRRLPEIVPFMLCVCAGVLQFLLFVGASAASGGADVVDHRAEARALGLAALRVLPAAATVTFFLGTMLIFAALISAGGEGGGAAAAGEGEEPIQAPVGLRLLSRMALAAAAALFCMMAVAVYGAYWYVFPNHAPRRLLPNKPSKAGRRGMPHAASQRLGL